MAKERSKQSYNTEGIEPFKWKSGQSGNPGGRPKKDLAAELALAVFERNPQQLYDAFVRAAKKGDPRIFEALANRAFGKVKEIAQVEHTGADGDPLKIIVELVNNGTTGTVPE